jgi:hypothetical protein
MDEGACTLVGRYEPIDNHLLYSDHDAGRITGKGSIGTGTHESCMDASGFMPLAEVTVTGA